MSQGKNLPRRRPRLSLRSRAIQAVVSFIAIAGGSGLVSWAFGTLNPVTFEAAARALGFRPEQWTVKGLLLAPLLHASWGHILGNSTLLSLGVFFALARVRPWALLASAITAQTLVCLVLTWQRQTGIVMIGLSVIAFAIVGTAVALRLMRSRLPTDRVGSALLLLYACASIVQGFRNDETAAPLHALALAVGTMNGVILSLLIAGRGPLRSWRQCPSKQARQISPPHRFSSYGLPLLLALTALAAGATAVLDPDFAEQRYRSVARWLVLDASHTSHLSALAHVLVYPRPSQRLIGILVCTALVPLMDQVRPTLKKATQVFLISLVLGASAWLLLATPGQILHGPWLALSGLAGYLLLAPPPVSVARLPWLFVRLPVAITILALCLVAPRDLLLAFLATVLFLTMAFASKVELALEKHR